MKHADIPGNARLELAPAPLIIINSSRNDTKSGNTISPRLDALKT